MARISTTDMFSRFDTILDRDRQKQTPCDSIALYA